MHPSLPLTTGTFNLVVKEPIRYRLSGRLQFRADLPVWPRATRPRSSVQTCLSSKLVQTTRLARSLSTHGWHRIFTCFPQPDGLHGLLWDRVSDPARSSKARLWRNCRTRSKTHLPPGKQHSTPMPFRHQPRRKSISLKKDHLEVSANNAFNPSRNLVPE